MSERNRKRLRYVYSSCYYASVLGDERYQSEDGTGAEKAVLD